MDWTLILILSGAVFFLAILRGIQAHRHDEYDRRGSEPGTGDHIIHSDYSSGAGGGGHHTTYRIPKDPQAYARRFVPKGRQK